MDACRAANSKRDNQTSLVTLTTVPTRDCQLFPGCGNRKKVGKAQRKLSFQHTSILISIIDSSSDNSDALELSPITDTMDPSSAITESLARILEFTAPANRFDYSTLEPSTRPSGL